MIVAGVFHSPTWTDILKFLISVRHAKSQAGVNDSKTAVVSNTPPANCYAKKMLKTMPFPLVILIKANKAATGTSEKLSYR